MFDRQEPHHSLMLPPAIPSAPVIGGIRRPQDAAWAVMGAIQSPRSGGGPIGRLADGGTAGTGSRGRGKWVAPISANTGGVRRRRKSIKSGTGCIDMPPLDGV